MSKTTLTDGSPVTPDHREIDPRTGQAYGITFPAVTICDMVRTQKRWLDSLGVRSLYAVIGGSILLFRLTDAEVNLALNAPLRDLPTR